jgi:hypothetical protein
MYWKWLQKVSAVALPVMYLAFVLASSLGVMHMGMQMGHDGHMHDCPYAKFLSVCDMTPIEHLSAWKSVFTTLGMKEISLIAFFALLAVFALHALSRQRRVPATRYRQQRGLYATDVRPFVRSLEDAFSNGILHSKAF